MAKRPLKVGLLIPSQTWGMDGETPHWPDILRMAQLAEQVGFDSLWLVDHLLARRGASQWRGGPPTPIDGEQRGCWECASLLAALAATVPRVELGTLVMCAGYRNPALLAKIAHTVDDISQGRLILGLGAGDAEFEHGAFGFPYDHRVSRFEESLQIIRGLLDDTQSTFSGQYHRIQDAVLRPPGPRPHGPPIMIGALAQGPRMLRLVAEYADMWNGWLAHSNSWPEAVAPLREAVDAACEAHGRDPATLARSVALRIAVFDRVEPTGRAIRGTPESIAAALRAHAEQGVDHVQVLMTPETLPGVEAMAPVLELLDRG